MSERWSDFSPFCGLFLGKRRVVDSRNCLVRLAREVDRERPTHAIDLDGCSRLSRRQRCRPPGATSRSREGSNVASRQVRPHSLDLLSSEVERSPKGPFGALCKISITSPALKPDQG